MIPSRLLQVGAGLAVGGAIVGAFVLSRVPRARDWLEQAFLVIETNAASNLVWFALGQVLVAACGILPAAIMAVMAGARLVFEAHLIWPLLLFLCS